jgi:hypothetical protein
LQLRSFAFGELGWSRDRYLSATLDEFNQSARVYWEKKEEALWHTREIVWTLILGNPAIPEDKKPKNKSDIYNLNIDKTINLRVKKPRVKKITEQDIRIFEQMQFGIKN